MTKIEASIPVYEIDGADAPTDARVTIKSHWNQNGVDGLVVVQFAGGPAITVAKRQLEKVIQACTGIK